MLCTAFTRLSPNTRHVLSLVNVHSRFRVTDDVTGTCRKTQGEWYACGIDCAGCGGGLVSASGRGASPTGNQHLNERCLSGDRHEKTKQNAQSPRRRPLDRVGGVSQNKRQVHDGSAVFLLCGDSLDGSDARCQRCCHRPIHVCLMGKNDPFLFVLGKT